MPPEDPRRMTEAVTRLVLSILQTLSAFEAIQRYLDPNFIPELVEMSGPLKPQLDAARNEFNSVNWPADFGLVRDRLGRAAGYAAEALDGFLVASRDPTAIFPLYRAVRRSTRAVELVYPLFPVFGPVNGFFVEEPLRESKQVLGRLVEAFKAPRTSAAVGVNGSSTDRRQRGGFSLYVPETYDGSAPRPLVVALHGGHGHGADFLWTWVREARSREFLVLAPTSQGDTWSLMGEDADGEPLRALVGQVQQAYNVDPERILLTGMSDGGSYAFLSGLQEQTPFTHLAPISCVLNPAAMADGSLTGARGKPIYLIHGALDWMFPVAWARMARDQLSAAGAELTYREIADLSHTYPRDENAGVLDWFGVQLPIGT